MGKGQKKPPTNFEKALPSGLTPAKILTTLCSGTNFSTGASQHNFTENNGLTLTCIS